MHDYLLKIIHQKKTKIDALYSEFGLSYFQEECKKYTSASSFYTQLSSSGLSLIAEIKKASPSKGIISHEFDPIVLAKRYDEAGAAAFSVLTETDFFKGDLRYIKAIKKISDKPILRKDFIIDPIQVYESKLAGADAILLIKALLTPDDCASLLTLAHDLSMDVLVEVHSKEELQDVLAINEVKLLGINNRNLHSFEVNIAISSELLSLIPNNRLEDLVVVAESGYAIASQLEKIDKEGFKAVLIGEGLLKSDALCHFFKKP